MVDVPTITFPEFRLDAILYLLPIAIAPAVEHVGGIMAISSVTGNDFLKNQVYIVHYWEMVSQLLPLHFLVGHQIQPMLK